MSWLDGVLVSHHRVWAFSGCGLVPVVAVLEVPGNLGVKGTGLPRVESQRDLAGLDCGPYLADGVADVL